MRGDFASVNCWFVAVASPLPSTSPETVSPRVAVAMLPNAVTGSVSSVRGWSNEVGVRMRAAKSTVPFPGKATPSTSWSAKRVASVSSTGAGAALSAMGSVTPSTSWRGAPSRPDSRSP